VAQQSPGFFVIISLVLPYNAIHPETRAAWRAWLKSHHTRPEGVWLVSWKKATGKPRFEYDAAVEEALCFGWVDSKPAKLDDERAMLWFAPRKVGTGWSAPNKLRVERAIAGRRMAAAGLAKVQAAKADGSWTRLDAVERLEVPDDLAVALATYPPATANFDAFPRTAKRGILEWIQSAKTAATRERRIAETATLAARNERANQWPRKAGRLPARKTP
jgi:uncharacterized protein YdeI (YjbR/CyaY-like superfamily)